MIVFCDDHTCRNNDGNACRATTIIVKVSTGIADNGTEGPVNVCSDYRSREDVQV